MRAARVHKPGPQNVIVVEDIDLPGPREQEVLVRVYAAGVGPGTRWSEQAKATCRRDLPQTDGVACGDDRPLPGLDGLNARSSASILLE